LRLDWRTSLALISGALCGCGKAPDLAPLRLRHSPPIERLAAPQLRALSIECEQYPIHGPMRGRYDSAYCEAAIAAWGDSPLQWVIIPAAPAPDGRP
jgi:hypothetical protein